MESPRLADLLRVIAAADVEVIVIGMLAGVLQGVPVMTLDVDVLHRRASDNVEKLTRLLIGLDARYRDDPRGLGPREDLLMLSGHRWLNRSGSNGSRRS